MDEPQHMMEYTTAATPARRLDPAELAETRLRRSGYPALQHISCESCAGVLTLRGHLPSYYLKQVAQTVVALIEGVDRIDNQIEVMAPPSEAGRVRLPQPGRPTASPRFE
jgi:hypothetical protein